MEPNVPARRVPRQARAERRVAAILDAAAALFAESGYEAATVTAMAARVGASIGSVYQFFPNKEAITEALAARYLGQLRQLYDTTLTPEAAHWPLASLVDRLVDPTVAFETEHPGFRALFEGAQSMTRLPATTALHDEVVGRTGAIFAARNPALDADHVRLYARLTVQIIKATLPLALESQGMMEARIVPEIKGVLCAYLAPRLDASPGR